MKPLRFAAAALAVALLVSCNGGGDGDSPPLLGATRGTGVTIYAFDNGTASPQNDGKMTVYGGAPGPSPDDPSVNGSGTVFAIALPN